MPPYPTPADRIDLSRRADLAEWMDGPSTYEDFRDCLRDLAQLNRVTFSHRPTLRFLHQLAAAHPGPLHIVDVGSGGGDLLRLVEARAHASGTPVVLTGIDLNPFAARAAREFTPRGSAIRWVTADVFSYRPDLPIDCIVSSLFTHHLSSPDIARFLAWMERSALRGWFVNDLYRARFPFYGIQLLGWLFRWHRFVRHDAPVSIRRGFSLEDWRHLIAAAGLPQRLVHMPTIGPARLCLARTK